MRARLVLCSFVAAAAFGMPGAHAATDTYSVAHGTGQLAFYGTPASNCTGQATVTFAVQQNQAWFTESWGSTAADAGACGVQMFGALGGGTNAHPTIQQCIPGVGGVAIPGYTLSQSGTTYTLQSTLQYCNGTRVVDKIVVTVRATNITFTHTFTEGTKLLVKGTGTIPRLA